MAEVHRRVPLIGLTTPANIAYYRNDLTRWLHGAGPPPASWGPLPTISEDRLDVIRRAHEVISGEPSSFPLRALVLNDLAQNAALLEACTSPDPDVFNAYSRDVHGFPTEATITSAHEILERPPQQPPDRTESADDLASAVATALRTYELDEWWTDLAAQHGSRISVSRLPRRIRIQADARFSPTEVARLVVHEVGGHVLRSHNAEQQTDPLAPLSLGSSLATEEGLSLWLEQWAGLSDPWVLRTYAARVLAVVLGASAGILEVAQELARVVDPGAAAAIATRAKRGLQDPRLPGGLTKDHSYLSGLHEVAQLIEHEGTRVVSLLYATKWPLSTLPVVRTLVSVGALDPASILPDTDRLAVADLAGHKTLM